jgi:hypothetical protein
MVDGEKRRPRQGYRLAMVRPMIKPPMRLSRLYAAVNVLQRHPDSAMPRPPAVELFDVGAGGDSGNPP